MGLGKTVQVAVALRHGRKDYRRVLIISPASLCLNWQREIERWAPDLVVQRVLGNATDRAYTYRLPIQVLIASYEQIRSDCDDLSSNLRFNLVVLDEAQRIKNRTSGTNLACRIIPRDNSWALTGTPLENEPQDLTAIFGFLKPKLLRHSMSRSQIHEAMQRHFLRRMKSEVLAELPPIISREIRLELGNRQRQTYEHAWNSRRVIRNLGAREATTNMLALLTRLKQICNFDEDSNESVKLDVVREIVTRLGTSDKILIFSQYVKTLMRISGTIGISHALFHGGLSMDTRDRILNAFRQQPGPCALLVSLQAGGVGLNLQEATTVIMFDRWWNPAKEDQAIHRAHRYGRNAPLEVIRFLVEESIEQRIDELLRMKKDLFDEYITAAPQDDRWNSQTLKEILEL